MGSGHKATQTNVPKTRNNSTYPHHHPNYSSRVPRNHSTHPLLHHILILLHTKKPNRLPNCHNDLPPLPLTMESSASFNVAPSPPPHHHRFRPTQPIADRIVRALRHRLRLLHRSGSDFYVLGATGNVYTVTLSTTPSCSCPDRTVPCKHILFVFLRVLGLSIDDTCLRRRTLRPCQLNRLLNAPVLPETLAGARTRETFHQLFSQLVVVKKSRPPQTVELEDGATCPVCLEEMVVGEGKEEKLVACSTCRNALHQQCLMTWRRSRGRRSATCVICRARWRDVRVEQEKYLNLAAFVDEDDRTVEGQGRCGD